MICVKLTTVNTIPKIVADIIKQTPFLEEAISLKIINLSSLARNLYPEINKKLPGKISMDAIIMALKRIEDKNQYHSLNQFHEINISNLTVRTKLTEFTFINSPYLTEEQEKIIAIANKDKSSFITFTHGVFETTFIISSNLATEIEKIFQNEKLIFKLSNLSAITILLPKKAVQQPGLYYQILKKLAWENINIVEVISSMTELTIILDQENIDKAFSVLKK